MDQARFIAKQILKLRSAAGYSFPFLLMAALLASSLSLFGQPPRRVQLKDFRSRFVGQRIVINPDFSNMRLSALAGWQFVKEEKGLGELRFGRHRQQIGAVPCYAIRTRRRIREKFLRNMRKEFRYA